MLIYRPSARKIHKREQLLLLHIESILEFKTIYFLRLLGDFSQALTLPAPKQPGSRLNGFVLHVFQLSFQYILLYVYLPSLSS